MMADGGGGAFRSGYWAKVLTDAAEDRSLTGTALRTYVLLSSYADKDTRQAFPRKRVLADRLGVDVSTVRRSLRQLERAGLIRTRLRRNADGGFRSNVYQVAPYPGNDNDVELDDTVVRVDFTPPGVPGAAPPPAGDDDD